MAWWGLAWCRSAGCAQDVELLWLLAEVVVVASVNSVGGDAPRQCGRVSSLV